jgi:hypothetical protein
VAQIMKKEFYIVIPFDNNENNSVKDSSFFWVFSSFWKSVNQATDLLTLKNQLKTFTKLKKWLISRFNWVKTWLENIWIRAEALKKQELVAFLADYYNPRLDSLMPVSWKIENYNLTN